MRELVRYAHSQPPAAPPAPPASTAVPAEADGSVRTIPHGTYSHRMMLEGGRDWYPPQARRRTLTGRVVVEFRINAAGKPEDVRINRAEADRILQIAAVYMVTTFRFDTKDPLLDPTDSRPYLISISYQLIGCNTQPVPSYPGFDADRRSFSPDWATRLQSPPSVREPPPPAAHCDRWQSR